MKHGHVRCIDSDNRYNRAIEREHGFDRLFGVSQRTYRGTHEAIALLERNVASTIGYSTAAYQAPRTGNGRPDWVLTVFRTGRKD